MLVLGIDEGESLLADGDFEIRVARMLDAGTAELEIETTEPMRYSSQLDRTVFNGMTAVGQKTVIRMTVGRGRMDETWLRLGDCWMRVTIKRQKEDGTFTLRFAIEAPEAIRFKRPAQHGGKLRAISA